MVLGQKNIIKINLGITHWKCQKLNQKRKIMKILFYVILELIFIIAAWFWGDLFFISMLKPEKHA